MRWETLDGKSRIGSGGGKGWIDENADGLSLRVTEQSSPSRAGTVGRGGMSFPLETGFALSGPEISSCYFSCNHVDREVWAASVLVAK